ncbi:MAG: type 1 glutamine amidotransferase [Solirubrobacteraceae bacterium]|jgi:GMP synthase (glutamine-hydrolysing)|nr:type 1 glutamine amidotransferase [Solirubrobacteraceae bacterium]
MARILAITHPGGGTSGVFHDGAARAGAALEEWCPAHAPEPPAPLHAYAALLVLGGDQNVAEQDRFPYLTGELELLAAWLESGRPAFGVCLGAQLIAAAGGGEVVRAPERELGWLEVELLPAGREDPVLGFGAPAFTAFQWHSWAVEPPPGAVALAASPVCLQAFRLGAAWGVQYHPEVTAAILEDWIADLHGEAGDPLTRERDAAAIRAGMAPHLERWNAYGTELFRRFAARLG